MTTKTKKTKTDQVTVNTAQELYVIPCCEGYSCLGFDVCIKWANGIAKWLGVPGVDNFRRGSMAVYDEYVWLCEMARERNVKTGERCPALLTPQLIGLEGKRVEVVDCWGETHRFWVGKSTGWLPIHLEIEKKSDSGGGGVVGSPFKSVKVIR